MLVPETPIRDMIDQAFQATDCLPNDQVDIELARGLAATGLTVMELGNWRWDYSNTCIQYVFERRLQEPWAVSGVVPDELLLDTNSFLLDVGYKNTGTPSKGDIITYGYGQDTLTHVGLVATGGSLVVSKFGKGPVVLGEIGAVPTVWGDHYFFYRKQ